jgi:TetR/AcrR family transcriptional regulator, transcriptional repressor for nem operon
MTTVALDLPKTNGHIVAMRQSDTREQLLAAGLKTLHRQGFNGSGVQDVTDAAGVPKGSFYNHFESKEAFGAEVVARFWERGAASRRLLSDDSKAPLDRLRAYFADKAAHAAPYELGCMIGNFSAELAGQSRLVRDQLGVLYAGWTRLIANCIREAQQAGQVAADIDALTLAGFVIDAWEGAVLRSKVERDGAAFERFERIVFSKILA